MIISPNDRKQYQALTLNNGLRVVMVHDADSEKSAASLTVNCGHFDDPQSRQGMAHFLEHMLFLGTQSNPEPGAFHQFISEHGGNHNAWTGTEHTSFFFDIDNSFIDEALTRFSEFFSEPLLSQTYIEKERNAIDAEYKLKLKEDSHRIYQVHKESINPAHPFAKFSVGNSDTLADKAGSNIRDELIEFHQRYYVPRHMTLAVLSDMPLAQQQQLVERLFQRLEDRPGPTREITEPMYLPEHQQVMINIVPHKHAQKLVASFAMPNVDKDYRKKTVPYLAHLIGHEGAGSLLSKLKRLGWANHLSVGRGISGSNFKDFNLSFELTDAGMQHIDQIVEQMFEAIDLLHHCDNHEALYEDKRKLMQLAFDYQEKTKPINQVSHLSTNMFNYEQQHYLYGDYIMEGFDQQIFDAFLALLRPDNLRLIRIHPEVDTDKVAKWYDTPYGITPVPKASLEHWQHTRYQDPELSLPTVNPYLKNEVKIEPKIAAEMTDIPVTIASKPSFNFFFKQDDLFEVPKGHCYIAIDSPISAVSITNIAITRLFTELFLDAVLEQHYNAELAGLSYHVYVHQGGLTVHTSGISTNQHLLVEQLLDALQTLNFSEARFNELKKQLYAHWLNSAKSKPVSQLFSVLTGVLQPNNPTMAQMADALLRVDFNAFQAVREQLFTQVHVDAFAYGNWRKAQAEAIKDTVESSIFSKATPHSEVARPVLSLVGHDNLAIERLLQHNDNAIVLYHQGRDRSALTTAFFIVLNQLIGPSFFHQLRTEKQLGYLVGTGYVPLNRYPGIALYIQSPEYDSVGLLDEIESFFEAFCSQLTQIDSQTWLKMQKGVITQVLEKDANLRVRAQRFWIGIGNKDIEFDERDKVAQAVRQMTPQDLFEFVDQTLLRADDGRLVAMTRSKSNLNARLQVVEPARLSKMLQPLEH